MLHKWIEENYGELKTICKLISNADNVDDLLHVCIEQLFKSKKIHDIPDREKLFYFTKIAKNNFYSKTAPYNQIYNRRTFSSFIDYDIPDTEYQEEQININWVKEQLTKLKKDNWYYARLMELYIEEDCSITKLSKKTTIPINSVSRDINKIRKQLKQIRDDFRNNN